MRDYEYMYMLDVMLLKSGEPSYMVKVAVIAFFTLVRNSGAGKSLLVILLC